jgi:hypothetical protein
MASLRLFVFLPLSVLLIAPLLTLLERIFPTLSLEGLWLLLLGNAGVLGVALGNAGVLGLALINAQNDHGLLQAAALSLGAGLGFWLVLSLFSDLRERTADNDIPCPSRPADRPDQRRTDRSDFSRIQWTDQNMSLIQLIDALLPQTQCGKCGHPGCKPYAKASSTANRSTSARRAATKPSPPWPNC